MLLVKRVLLEGIIALLLIMPVYGLVQSDEISDIDTVSYEFWLFPLSTKILMCTCQSGDTLTGSFTVAIDGDLYYGDQQKYDLWVGWGAGVDFYVSDQTNMDLLLAGENCTPLYCASDVTSLSWHVEIPYSGQWYVIFDNDSSVYGKQIRASILQNEGQLNVSFIILILLVSVSTVSFVFIAVRRIRKNA